jgi:Na+-translocating ferredoxin:NAD+ oxidoreductase RnfG subunit
MVAGYVFWTTDLEPLERGYDGPIKMLVGLDMNAKLTGVLVTEHHEPYGYFSVEPPRFAQQFKGKNIRDPFKVGADIDAVSRASITINSSTRAIRNSARGVARALLTPQGIEK